jgi:hypothetical protein
MASRTFEDVQQLSGRMTREEREMAGFFSAP